MRPRLRVSRSAAVGLGFAFAGLLILSSVTLPIWAHSLVSLAIAVLLAAGIVPELQVAPKGQR